MRILGALAAVATMLVLWGCESVSTTEAAASPYPTVRCPIYEGYPDCSAELSQANASGR